MIRHLVLRASKLLHGVVEDNVLEPLVRVHVLWQRKLDSWAVTLTVQGVVQSILVLLVLVHTLWVICLVLGRLNDQHSQSVPASTSNSQTLARNARHFANVSERRPRNPPPSFPNLCWVIYI